MTCKKSLGALLHFNVETYFAHVFQLNEKDLSPEFENWQVAARAVSAQRPRASHVNMIGRLMRVGLVKERGCFPHKQTCCLLMPSVQLTLAHWTHLLFVQRSIGASKGRGMTPSDGSIPGMRCPQGTSTTPRTTTTQTLHRAIRASSRARPKNKVQQLTSAKKRPLLLARAIMSLTCLAFMPMGFSHSTCFPALSIRLHIAWCEGWIAPRYAISGRKDNGVLYPSHKILSGKSLKKARAFIWATRNCLGKASIISRASE